MSLTETTAPRSYAPGEHPDLPPPGRTGGILTWMQENLFSGIGNSFLTLLALTVLAVTIPPFIDWAFLTADFSAPSRFECEGEGACWAVVTERWRPFLFGFYPGAEAWRLIIAGLLLPVAVTPLLFPEMPYRNRFLWVTLASPFLLAWLLGGGLGLEEVGTERWGGLMLTLVIGVTGIAASLPIGVALALGRQSDLPVIRILCTSFIETIRGVPLITLLFFSSVMLPLFLPEGVSFDKLLRALIVIALFASAYMAEVVRGGLQAIPKGQIEAAQALGLGYWRTTIFVVLPQALRIAIPGIVNTFIGLFKDTSLVTTIGLLELVGIAEATLTDQDWLGLRIEVYLFVGFVFWIFCFGISRYSLWLERRLGHDEKHRAGRELA